jgi:diguanylate cyclase (GGDEF)-like protein
MTFDIRLLWLIGALCGAGFGLLVLLVRKTYPNYLGRVLLFWGASYLCLGASYALWSERTWVGDYAFNAVSHTLVALCLSLELKAVRELKRKTLTKSRFLIAPLLMLAACTWFTVVQRNITVELLLFNGIDMAMMILIARTLALPEEGQRPRIDLMAMAVYLAAAMLTFFVIVDYFREGLFSREYDFECTRSYVNSISGIVSEGLVFSLFLLLVSERLNRTLVIQAMLDALTGLYNRRAFQEIAFRELAGAARTRNSVSILVFDIDHFKAVNDKRGHMAGDQVLRAVADTLRYCLRDEDFLCRWGGDEFCALLPRANREQAEAVATRVLETFETFSVRFEADSIEVSVSIGIMSDQGDQKDLTSLVELADAALFQAKQAGRNRFAFSHECTPA